MFVQSLKMAWKAISGNKMRSFLTMLGVIIGVIALVVLVSLVSSATDSITDQVSSLGNNLLTVSIVDDKENPLKLGELSTISGDTEIDLVSPVAQTNSAVKTGHADETATVYGVYPAYFEIQNLKLYSGRMLKTADVENSSYVAVISYKGADKMFGRNDVVGEKITVGGRSILIVGVLEEDESMMSMFGSDISLYMPYTVVTRITGQGTAVNSFYASSVNTESMDDAEAALQNLMLKRFKGDSDAYSIVNQSSLMDTMSSITGILTVLLGGIAAISLLVGGIGIMNIMLVSVTERTREIGIRKAIGAGRGTIMLQFIIEALALSLLGCAIGIGLSWGIIEIATLVAGDTITFAMSASVAGIAVAFSVGIGLIFGIYPANKAAKKNPIEALRYDG